MKKRKKIPPPICRLEKIYFVTFFIMWVIATVVGKNIIGYFDIFLPFIVASITPFIIHSLLCQQLSYKRNRIIKNILMIVFPTLLSVSIYLLTIITLKPVVKEFTIVNTSKFVCGKKDTTPPKYWNDFMSGKHTSKFEVKLNNYTVTWYPNKTTYYKYNRGDKIKIEVKKNFLDMNIIVQENKHWRLL